MLQFGGKVTSSSTKGSTNKRNRDVDFSEHESEKNAPVTKAQRREERRLKNMEWKSYQSKGWSGCDPNPRHTTYYKLQFPYLQTEWEQFQQSLRTELPVTFRLCPYRSPLIAKATRLRLMTEFKKMTGRFIQSRGDIISDVVSRVDSFGRHTYQLHVDGRTLADEESGLGTFKSFLKRECALGHAVRQELVSMIPAILLDVREHHHVLDMCAAPGSKTEQLLGFMHPVGSTGFVIANDADVKRINILKERYSRCGSPNLLLSCCAAEDLLLRMRARNDALGERVGQFDGFDRVLCDVPCTGDGTFRKASHLWRSFRCRKALLIHSLQLRIAETAVKVLKPGGRVVYSTCSLNPIENEAVVSQLLRQRYKLSLGIESNNTSLYKLRLVDPRVIMLDVRDRAEYLNQEMSSLRTLRWREGVSHWHCDEAAMQFLGDEDDKPSVHSTGNTPEQLKRKVVSRESDIITPSMRPPSEAEAAEFELSKCMRVLPHDQDTGGFFVAVMELHRVVSESSDASHLTAFAEGFDAGHKRKALSGVGFNIHHAAISNSSNQKILKKWATDTGAVHYEIDPYRAYCASTTDGVTIFDSRKSEASISGGLSDEIIRSLCGACGIPIYSQSENAPSDCLHVIVNQKSVMDKPFGMKGAGATKQSELTFSISLLSSGAFKVLSILGDLNGLLLQSGSEIATVKVSPGGLVLKHSLRINPDNGYLLFSNCSGQRCLASVQEFSEIVRHCSSLSTVENDRIHSKGSSRDAAIEYLESFLSDKVTDYLSQGHGEDLKCIAIALDSRDVYEKQGDPPCASSTVSKGDTLGVIKGPRLSAAERRRLKSTNKSRSCTIQTGDGNAREQSPDSMLTSCGAVDSNSDCIMVILSLKPIRQQTNIFNYEICVITTLDRLQCYKEAIRCLSRLAVTTVK